MGSRRTSWFAFVPLALFGLLLGGCPTEPTGPGDGDTNGDGTATTGGVDTSRFTVVKLDIPVVYDASLECGTDLIVFGTGTRLGVSYVVPSTNPTAATPIPGDNRSQGFAVADKKVLLFNDEGRLLIYDTETEAPTVIPQDDVTLESLPTGDDEDILSPVVADGQWAVTRNRADAVADGRVLKVLDLSVDPPQITPLQNPPAGVLQVVIDSADQVVVTFSGERFLVYDITTPETAPRQIDLANQGGIAGPFAYDNGFILYLADAFPNNVRLLNIADGVSRELGTAPAHRLLSLAIKGGKYAYFLDRDANDTYAVVYRAAVGTVPNLTAVAGGVPGAPDAHTPPWDGFGNDLTITPDGSWVFISGDQVILESAEFLQVSAGGAFGRFVDGAGFLNASDVASSADVVAFKIGRNQNTRLGYIVLTE